MAINIERATPEKLQEVNERLPRGTGWIGYLFSKDRKGNRCQSRYLYIQFYTNGKPRRILTDTNDPEEAYKQLWENRNRISSGSSVLPAEAARITYEDMKALYLRVKPKAEKEPKIKHLDKFFGKMKVTQITSEVILDYIEERRDSVEEPTIRRELTILRAMFNMMRKFKKLSADQVPHFQMPKDSEAAGQYITPEQFMKILEHLPKGEKRQAEKGGPSSESNLQPLFQFMYATGCRLGATKAITWNSVGPDCEWIEIPAENTKNKQPLRLPLAGPFLESLKRMLQKEFKRENTPVFDSTNFRMEWAKAVAAAGLGTFDPETRVRTGPRCHDCRCSGAINLVDAGVDRDAVLLVGGWKTDAMLRRYNVYNIERLKNVMKTGGQYVTDKIGQAKKQA